VSALKSIIKSIQNNKNNKKSPRSQYILGVLAMSAIADKVMANEQPVQKEGVIIDVVKLLKDQGIDVTPENINDIVLALAEGQEGQLIDLGYGLYQFIAADAQAEVNLQISSVLLDTPILTEISLVDFTLVTDSTTLFAEADEEGESSGFDFSIPMLGLLAVAAMGGNSNSAQATPADTDPFAEEIVDAEFDYTAIKDSLAAQSVDSLTFSTFDSATFDMYDGAGGYVGGANIDNGDTYGVNGTFIIDSETGLGIGTFESDQTFFGNLWTAHDVVIQITSTTTAKLEMLFDWSVSLDIPVTLDVNITMDGDQITSFTAVDGDSDSILGNAMLSGPFTGFSPDFSGTTVTTTSTDDAATQYAALSYTDNAIITGDASGTTDEDGVAITGQLTVTDIDNAEGSTSSIELENDASNGTATIDASGNWTYTPNANFNGDDSFTVNITDDLGNVSIQTIDLTVNSINDIPVAAADSVESGTDAYTLSTYDLSGVFKMKDANGDAVGTDDNTVAGSLSIDHATGEGTIIMTSTQTFYGQLWTATDITFAQNADTSYTADMTFTWGSSVIAVTLDLDATFNADGTATLTAIDGPGADGIVGNPMDNGPFTGFNAGFDFALSNQADVAYAAVAGAAEDTAYVIDVLSNDTDIDGDTLTVIDASAPNGTVVINADNTLTYTGDLNYNGTDTITYTISDGNGGESTAEVSVGISAVNDAPVATDDTAITVDEDTASAAINVLANDSDVEGDTLSVTDATATNGTVVVNADGTLTYTGNQDFNGEDTITYTLSDGNGGTDTATVAVDVTAVNDAPVVDTDAIRALMGDVELGGDAVTFDVLANTSDAEGGSLSITSVSTVNYMGADGAVVDNGDGTLTFTPAVAGGSQNITVSVSDGTETTNSTFSVTVVDNIDEAAIAQAAADAAAAEAAAQAAADAAAAAEASPIVMNDQLIQLRNMGPVTKAEVSTAEYGADYSSASDTAELIKFEIWVDTDGITTDATEIRGYEFNIDWNTDDVEALGLTFVPGDLIGTTNTNITFNSTTGDVAMASSGAIVDTDPNNNLAFNGNIQAEKLVATFYLNPTDAAAQDLDITITDILVVTDTNNITPEGYTMVDNVAYDIV